MPVEGPPVVRSAPFGPAGLGAPAGEQDRSDVRLEPLVLAAMILMLWAAA